MAAAASSSGSTLAPPPLSTSERALVLSALLNSDPPHRAHSRPALAFRPIDLQTGILPSAHGSARLTLGAGTGGGFDSETVTEVLVGVSVEVKKVELGEPPVTCSVEVDPALQHSLPAPYSTESLSNSLTNLLSSAIRPTTSDPEDESAPPPLFPNSQRQVIPGQSNWHFYIDATILSLSAGNLVDAVFAAVFAALSDVRIPRTRPIRFRSEDAKGGAGGGGLLKQKGDELGLIKQTRQDRAVDFELLQDDTGLGGDRLENWEAVPVCITVSLLPQSLLLDADATEALVVPSQIHVIASASGHVHGVHFAGPGGFWEASDPKSSEEANGPGGLWNPNESIQRGMGSRYEAVKNAIKVGVNSASSLSAMLIAQIEEQQRARQQRLLAG
ncbi:hypothetical protein OC846_004893 [Tilletia horrida]|uniref:Ribosomal RNA-processing protein 42 n=1 Tax=Tilletia horrida TaxID=155126 RepID=A0AAN6GMB1_9BASI|nr:hypothetical protein OC845_005039 [Tilletia horrida]KAK0547352.1 hypothetical protein OC846_004893 [Tilletia horrida]KAK0562781.1 hypothetical protein OC861_005138 [Tilletia horrida]